MGRHPRPAPEGPFRTLRAAQPVISRLYKAEAAQGLQVQRKVVNISSVAGTDGNAGQANYSSAKAGVIGLTKTLAKEWGRYQVNVNAVAFGWIMTRLTEGPPRPASDPRPRPCRSLPGPACVPTRSAAIWPACSRRVYCRLPLASTA